MRAEKNHDRTARLLYVLHILNCHPNGVSVPRISQLTGVTVRTIYRDLDALEEYLKVPLIQDGTLRSLPPGSFLPPVSFSVPEAMTVFMASRLLLAQSRVYNPHIATTFRKLSGVLDANLREEVERTLRWMERRKPDDRAVNVLNDLGQCWLKRRRARIRYWTLNREHAVDRVIEPYYIQPSALDHATYVIGFCHLRDEVRVFRLDRINDVRILEDTYEIPESFDANVYLSSYLGITASGRPQVVRLRFHPDIARVAAETLWHDSQVTEPQTDGSAVVTMKLAVTHEVVSFVLNWADKVEVLAPKNLKRQVAEAARVIRALYEVEEPAVPAMTASAQEPQHAAVEAVGDDDGVVQLGLWGQ